MDIGSSEYPSQHDKRIWNTLFLHGPRRRWPLMLSPLFRPHRGSIKMDMTESLAVLYFASHQPPATASDSACNIRQAENSSRIRCQKDMLASDVTSADTVRGMKRPFQLPVF
jgi:hypothetical protein